jgi:16S rRNA (cytosine967-C5)-methyltransferase
VTDAAAQMAPLAVGSHPGGRILDAGSGRGTKTLALQALAVDRGAPADIVGLDIHAFKARLLEERMEALGVPGVSPVTVDLLDPAASDVLGEPFDAVLLDAPCTGLGTLRRHPEQRWRVSEEDVARLAILQADLLDAAAALVRPGGLVVYSTCSLARAENHDVVAAFLAGETGREFLSTSLANVVPAGWERFLTEEGWFQSVPATDGPDGHFVARLERQAG